MHDKLSRNELERDPNAHLSRTSLMDAPGYYVPGGASPYTVAFQEPITEFMLDRHPAESLVEYVERRRLERPDLVLDLLTSGLPANIASLISEQPQALSPETERRSSKLAPLIASIALKLNRTYKS